MCGGGGQPSDFNVQQRIGTDVLNSAFLTTANNRLLVYPFSKFRFANTEFVHSKLGTHVNYLTLPIIILSTYKKMENFGPYPTTTRSESAVE